MVLCRYEKEKTKEIFLEAIFSDSKSAYVKDIVSISFGRICGMVYSVVFYFSGDACGFVGDSKSA